MQGISICRDCCYFEKTITGLGHCKRFPPTIPPHMVIEQPTPRFDVTPIAFEKEPWLSPVVDEEDWCGEFSL